jgi:ribosomal protein S18 acetylase RimI-like enzyme
MTFRIRSFKESDLPKLQDQLEGPFSEQRLLYMHYFNGDFSSWLLERKIEVSVAEDETGVIGSAAYNDGFWGEEIEWLIVCNSANRKLVEEKLVTEAELHVKKGAVFTAVDADSPKIEEWTRRGYYPNGGLYYMLTRLADLKPVPEVPKDVVLRSLRATEEKEFVKLVNAGFAWERVKLGDIQKWKTESPPFNEEWISVAEDDGKLVSVVVSKPDTGYNRFFKAKRGYLGPAATLPEWRGRNLASALTVRAINSLFERKMDSVCLFTLETNTASVKLLLNIGFEVGHSWKFMLKQILDRTC